MPFLSLYLFLFYFFILSLQFQVQGAIFSLGSFFQKHHHFLAFDCIKELKHIYKLPLVGFLKYFKL